MRKRGGLELAIAWADADGPLGLDLVTHLKGVAAATRGASGWEEIQVWHPDKVPSGQDAREHRLAAVAHADVVVFLVSADLLANEVWAEAIKSVVYANRFEPRGVGLEDGWSRPSPHVIPVLVRHVARDLTPFAGLTMIPAEGKALTDLPADKVWTLVVEEIQRMWEQKSRYARERGLERRGAQELWRRVLDVTRLRHPHATLEEDGAPSPFLGLIVRREQDGRRYVVEPIGVLESSVTEEVVQAFYNDMQTRFREDDPLLSCRIVHQGKRVGNDLYTRALRKCVILDPIDEYEDIVRFEPYLAWQTERIDRDPLYPDSLYVNQRAEVRVGLDRTTTKSALDSLSELLRDNFPRFLLVLGDFGTGKTFLMRQLARRLAARKGALPPVLVEMRSLEKAHDLDSLLAQHFQLLGDKAIKVANFRYLLAQGKAVLLFDGFDELAFRVTPERVKEHFQTVLQAAEGKAKVVVTSRTTQFLTDNDAERELARKAAEREGYRLLKLKPFEEDQIRDVLRKRLKDPDAVERRMDLLHKVEDLMGLSSNPRMLDFILELPEEDLEKAKNRHDRITAASLYERLVERWLGFEEGRMSPKGADPPLTLKQLWKVVTDLAVMLWPRTEKGIPVQDIPADLWVNLQKIDPSRPLDPEEAKSAAVGRSLLIRSDEGRFSFLHESILDWFVAREMARKARNGEAVDLLLRTPMSRLMVDFFVTLAESEAAATWAREALGCGVEVGVANANLVLIKADASGALEPDISVDLDLSGHDLSGQDLSNSRHLRGAFLENANLQGVSLAGADLTGARLNGAQLSGADLRGAVLVDAQLSGANLTGALCTQADFQGASLEKADLTAANDAIQPDRSGIGRRQPDNGQCAWGLGFRGKRGSGQE
ncbi:MAG: pentapeptide repeat-containing protein [Polyangiaceae bacterium]|nr:pentapeptide repeat-containing protein [Polyangiaceae bacterium]